VEGPAVKHYDFRTTSVLVVDDNRFMRTILRNALTSMNFGNIDEARSGTQALDMIRGADYDLIITDLEMDGGDGLSLMSDMRNDSGVLNPLVPVIVISGNTTAESVMTARDHGATEFLAKPLSPDSLYETSA
jgi:two-component system chemotaxis response regulator CheY